MSAPFGVQIIFYLFLAGVAAGSALVASMMLHRADPTAFTTGKRSLVLSIIAIGLGVILLIADLANPAEFFLILSEANTQSAIAWGARIVTAFTLIAIFVWTLYRNKTTGSATVGECAALWLLRLLALSLAIYPGFVLWQGKAIALWNTWLIVPLIALSGLHAGFAASSLLSGNGKVLPSHQGLLEKVFLVALGLLVIALLVMTKSTSMLAIIALITSVVVPVVLLKRGAAVVTSLSILVGSFCLRAWLISDGQSLFF